MKCPTCGALIQPGATSCVGAGCPDAGKPLSPQLAAPSDDPYATVPLLVLRPFAVALTAVTVVGVAAMFTVLQINRRTYLDEELTTLTVASVLALVALYAVLVPIAGGLAAIWAYRARRNVDALPGTDPTQSPRMAIAAWFIPVGSFWLVPRVLNDIVRQSAAASSRTDLICRVSWVHSLSFYYGLTVQYRALSDGTPQGITVATAVALLAAVGVLAPVWYATLAQSTRRPADVQTATTR
jgi:hypothetical protein